MKIQTVEICVVRLPLEEPLVNAPPFTGMLREFVTVQVYTGDGIEGIGVTGFGGRLLSALKAAVAEFGNLIIGEDPLNIESVVRKLKLASAHCGPGGIAMLALTAIDMALWDIRGKASGQSLTRMLGGLRDRVPAYASGALMRGTPTDRLHDLAVALVKKGYTQLKTQMAVEGASPTQEVERIRIIRDAVGPDITLMVDINQRWSVHEAIDFGHRVEEFGLGWLEDVTRHDDYQGLAAVAAALTTPVCGGECLYGIEPFRQMLEHHSVDIVMIDLLRVGGITPWMKVAGMSEAFNTPVVSHLLPEIHVHLVASAPNATVVEYMPWTWRLFDDPPMPENGFIRVPDRPGLGLAFAKNLFERFGA